MDGVLYPALIGVTVLEARHESVDLVLKTVLSITLSLESQVLRILFRYLSLLHLFRFLSLSPTVHGTTLCPWKLVSSHLCEPSVPLGAFSLHVILFSLLLPGKFVYSLRHHALRRTC